MEEKRYTPYMTPINICLVHELKLNKNAKYGRTERVQSEKRVRLINAKTVSQPRDGRQQRISAI